MRRQWEHSQTQQKGSTLERLLLKSLSRLSVLAGSVAMCLLEVWRKELLALAKTS